MRGSAIAVMCVLLVGALLCPSMAVAGMAPTKGGNGSHAAGTGKASGNGKDKSQKSNSGKNEGEKSSSSEKSGNEKAAAPKAAAPKAAAPEAAAPEATAPEATAPQAQRPDGSKKPVRPAEQQASSPQQDATQHAAREPADRVRRAQATEEARKARSSAQQLPASEAPSAKFVPGPVPAQALAEGRMHAHGIEPAEIETRGVMDTIEMRVSASLGRARAGAVSVWSAVASWFGD
jgi:hypothetical protein